MGSRGYLLAFAGLLCACDGLRGETELQEDVRAHIAQQGFSCRAFLAESEVEFVIPPQDAETLAASLGSPTRSSATPLRCNANEQKSAVAFVCDDTNAGDGVRTRLELGVDASRRLVGRLSISQMAVSLHALCR